MGHAWVAVQSWLWEKAYTVVDTWIPITSLHGALMGSVHVEFIGTGVRKAGPPSTAGADTPLPTSVTLVNTVIERATLLTSPCGALGEVCWSTRRRSRLQQFSRLDGVPTRTAGPLTACSSLVLSLPTPE